jgi:hypothetical protein
MPIKRAMEEGRLESTGCVVGGASLGSAELWKVLFWWPACFLHMDVTNPKNLVTQYTNRKSKYSTFCVSL